MGSSKNIGNPTAMKCSELSETTLDKDQYSRMRNAYNWYTLLSEPRRVTMHRILDYTTGADFTHQDVGLLPWNLEETEVAEEAMKAIKKEKKEKTEKKQKKKKKKETFLKEELGNSLTSLDTSLNSSSDYMNASFTSLESSMNSSGGFLDASFNSCLDLDGTRYESEKGEESETREFEVNCELLQTIKAEKECISKMAECRQKWVERRQRDDQQKREEAKKNAEVKIKDDSEEKKEKKQTKKKETFLKKELSEDAMKSIKKEKKEKTEKKKKETFLKGELGHSLTSLETSLNSSSGCMDASLNSCWDPDGTRYECEKREFEVNCELLQTITAEEECISKMVERHCKREECRQKIDDQQKREEAKKKSMERVAEVEIKEDSEDARRQRAFQWYMRMARPCRKEFKRQLAALLWTDITEDDVDSLPWNLTGSRVSIAKMNAFTRACIMNN